jgi:hypothetical protein
MTFVQRQVEASLQTLSGPYGKGCSEGDLNAYPLNPCGMSIITRELKRTFGYRM